MTSRKPIPHEPLLDNPHIQSIVSNVNPELIERRETIPPSCEVFNTPVTGLEQTDRFRFQIHPEAARRLPDIMDNQVQTLVGVPDPDEATRERYTRRRNIGIVFSGGPAPGGHNVIAGIFDAAKAANPDNTIFGFIQGPDGIIEGEAIELTADLVDRYRNLGGFGMIRTGRTKIDTVRKMDQARKTCRDLKLDALVVVGGDDSNTNAAFLAQEMIEDGIQVIGVPKTIDGDIQVRDADGDPLCAMSFGFHSAARGFACEISNLCTDCASDVKYWHICKVMGRVASHLALEVALQTHANITLIGEDLADYIDDRRLERAEAAGTVDYTAYGMTLRHVSRVICNGIVRRAAAGKSYGVIVIPEGLLEFINEIQVFIIKLNTIIADYNKSHDTDFHDDFPHLEDKLDHLRRLARLSREGESLPIWSTRDDDLFNDLPEFFREGLLTERDSHGNFQFSQVETDKVVMGLVRTYLNYLRETGEYKIGIERRHYEKVLRDDGLDPDAFGHILFQNYDGEGHLLMKPSIISLKTLQQTLENEKAIVEGGEIPPAIAKIYKKSVPSFKTQTHFYGYDGRGSNPTWFDRTYTYNLGQTVFGLVANGATGQMAAIRNLEQDFDQWEPIGIPIAALMHLEERNSRLELVIERSVVDVSSPAFRVVKAMREKWLAAHPGEDNYRIPAAIYHACTTEEDRPITLWLNAAGSRQ